MVVDKIQSRHWSIHYFQASRISGRQPACKGRKKYATGLGTVLLNFKIADQSMQYIYSKRVNNQQENWIHALKSFYPSKDNNLKPIAIIPRHSWTPLDLKARKRIYKNSFRAGSISSRKLRQNVPSPAAAQSKTYFIYHYTLSILDLSLFIIIFLTICRFVAIAGQSWGKYDGFSCFSDCK